MISEYYADQLFTNLYNKINSYLHKTWANILSLSPIAIDWQFVEVNIKNQDSFPHYEKKLIEVVCQSNKKLEFSTFELNYILNIFRRNIKKNLLKNTSKQLYLTYANQKISTIIEPIIKPVVYHHYLRFFVFRFQEQYLNVYKSFFKQVCSIPSLKEHIFISYNKTLNNICIGKKRTLSLFNYNFSPYGLLFNRDSADYVANIDTNIYAIGAAPEIGARNKNLVIHRFFSSILREIKRHPKKEFIIIVVAKPDIEFSSYLKNDTYGGIKVEVKPNKNFSSLGINGYNLQVNRQPITVFLIRNAPDKLPMSLENKDLLLLYENVYSCKNKFIFHHCKSGIGRSAELCFMGILFKKWDKLIVNLHQIKKNIVYIEVNSLAIKIMSYFKDMSNYRLVLPRPEQIHQAINFAAKMKVFEVKNKMARKYIKEININVAKNNT